MAVMGGGVSGTSSVEGGGSLLPAVPHGGGWPAPELGPWLPYVGTSWQNPGGLPNLKADPTPCPLR